MIYNIYTSSVIYDRITYNLYINSTRLWLPAAQDVGIKDTLGSLVLAGTDLANQLAKKASKSWEHAGNMLGKCWDLMIFPWDFPTDFPTFAICSPLLVLWWPFWWPFVGDVLNTPWALGVRWNLPLSGGWAEQRVQGVASLATTQSSSGWGILGLGEYGESTGGIILDWLYILYVHIHTYIQISIYIYIYRYCMYVYI